MLPFPPPACCSVSRCRSETHNDNSFGLRGAYRANPHFTLEGGWTHTSVTARTTVPETNSGTGPLLATTSVTIDAFEVTGLYEWGRGSARGYFGFGAGAMNLSDSGAGLPNMTPPKALASNWPAS